MARKSARRTAYRKAPARGSYSTRSWGGGTGARRRSGARSGNSRQQVVRLVIETLPQSAVARPEGAPLQKLATPPRQSKF